MNRVLLALWLLLTSIAWVIAAFLALGALAMSFMVFGAPNLSEEPGILLLIPAMAMLFILTVSGLILQWIFFAVKRNGLAGGISLLPFIGLMMYAGPYNRNTGSRASDDREHLTVNPADFDSHEVQVNTFCPGLETNAPLHLRIHPFIEGESELGLPMKPLGDGLWTVTFRYPAGHFLFNYNLGDDDHAATSKLQGKRPNVDFDLASDTLLLDTVPGWLDIAPVRAHWGGFRLEELQALPPNEPTRPDQPDTIGRPRVAEPALPEVR